MSLFKKPCAVRWTPDGFESTNISYDDYAGMGVTKGRLAAARRLETPAWALNDSLLRDLIVVFVETRAQVNGDPKLSWKERVDFALSIQLNKKPHFEERLTPHCHALVDAKNRNDLQAVKKLTEMIEALDTQILWMGKEDQLAAGVVYYYYRLGYNSAETGTALGIKPPHVRQTLWRLAQAYKIVTGERPIPMSFVKTNQQKSSWTPEQLKSIRLFREYDNLSRQEAIDAVLAGKIPVAPTPTLPKPRPVFSLEAHAAAKRERSAARRQVIISVHVKRLEELAAAQPDGCLPSHRWLDDNGFCGSKEWMKKCPEAFAHIPRKGTRGRPKGQKQETIPNHVKILEGLAAANDGLLPPATWLVDNGFNTSYNAMRLYPELFAHIKRMNLCQMNHA